ncbi:MAG: type II toxin-antitoxin system Phd/YefM family antitoxin, partial [Schleiferiaceae bacterium]
TGNGAVVLSIEEYNQMLETMHLLKSKANADHLYASMKELDGKLIEWQVNEQ